MPSSISPPSLSQRLATYVSQRQPTALLEWASSLRSVELRKLSVELSKSNLWHGLVEEDFWLFFLTLCRPLPKVFLGTMLKAAQTYHLHTPLSCRCAAWREFARQASEIDRRKTLDALLPLFDSPSALQQLVADFSKESLSNRVLAGFWLRAATPASYFLLFGVFRQWEDNPALLRRYAVELLRRGEKISFNLASILQAYFHLAPLPGTFSLQLPPYELSRLETDYEHFYKILTR